MATTLPLQHEKPTSSLTHGEPPDSAISISTSSNFPEDESSDSPSRPQLPSKSYTEPSQAVYRPDPTSIAGPSTQPQQYITPPPYSGPLISSPTTSYYQQQKPTYPGLPHLNYPLYHPPSFTLSPDTTTLSSSSPHLQSLSVLLPLLHQLAALPPKPQVRIIGKTGDRVDFDVKINCMGLFVPDGRREVEGEEGKRKMNYLRVIGREERGWRGERGMGLGEAGEEELGVEGWVERFLRDGRGIKSFTLERQVANWDTTYLHGRLLTLINNTNYRGTTTISFPIAHSRITINSPPKINQFFSKIEKIFTGTRKYEVLKSVWPYADVPRDEGGRRGEGRKCVVQDEEEWFLGWRDAVRHAVVGRRRGWVTVEDRLEFLMEPRGEEGGPEMWVDN